MKIILVVFMVCLFTLSHAQDLNHPVDSTKSIISNEPFRLGNTPAPLYILNDKEIAYADLNAIKPDDIKTITVLKDSSAIKKYGERARSGVVIIELADATKPSHHKKRPTPK